MISTYCLFENQEKIVKSTIEKIPKVDKKTLISDYQAKINKSKQYLKKFGITTNFEKFTKSISRDMKKGKDPKAVAAKISKKINDTISETVNISASEKVKRSIGITVLLIVINTLTFLFFGAINPALGLIVGATIVAPVIEEYAKRLAVLDKMPWAYTSIFAGTEFLLYIVQGAAPIMRLIPIVMHFLTTFIQKKLHDSSITLNNKTLSQIGFFVAVFIHVSNNTLAVLSELN